MDRQQMLLLRLKGYPYSYIAKQAGVSRQRIQQVLSPPKKVKEKVIEKYRGLCEDCGAYVGRSGHIHRRKGENEESYLDVENLSLLCISCHRIRHGGAKGLNSELWQQLNERRRVAGDTWKQLANLMGVSVDMLRLWGQGKREPGGKVMRAIVRVYPELAGYVLIDLFERRVK